MRVGGSFCIMGMGLFYTHGPNNPSVVGLLQLWSPLALQQYWPLAPSRAPWAHAPRAHAPLGHTVVMLFYT